MATSSRKSSDFFGAAFGAGMLGALLITLLMLGARALGIVPVNMELILGSLITRSLGTGTWIIGLSWHLLNGGIFGLLYAAGFRTVGRSSASLGVLFAFAHWAFSGILFGALPLLHPLIPDLIPDPGFFSIRLGWPAVIGNLFVHVVFGALVGAICSAITAVATTAEESESSELRRAG